VGSSASSTRPADDGPGDGHALLLAAGELRREVVDARGEADAVEGGERQAPALLVRQAPVEQRDLHVVEHREVAHQVELLEDEADLLVAQARELAVAVGVDRRAVDLDPSPRWARRAGPSG
jgi:hypothetical protein